MPGSSLTAKSTDITRQPRQRITRQKLDKARQLLDSSTDLDAQAHGVSLDKPRQARQARPRQQLDGASTARQLDSQGSSMNAVYDVYYPYQNGPVGVSTTDGLARTVAAGRGRRGWPLSTHYGPYGGSLRRLMPSLPCLVMVDASLDTA